MGEPDRLVNMVESIVERADVPVTAKMRLGTGKGANNATDICQRLEQESAQRLCIHGRTLRQRYSGEADWTSIREAVQAVDVPVVANGDVVDAASAPACLKHTGAWLMVGRGASVVQRCFRTSRSAWVGWNLMHCLGLSVMKTGTD